MTNIFTPYDSIGTENNTETQNAQNGGGCNFINSLFGTDNKYVNMTQLIVEMIECGELEVSDKLLIRGKFVPDMNYTDNEGNNLLHSLAKASCKSECAKKALIVLTRDGKNKKSLNCINKYGKQPLHYLNNRNNTDIMNYLVNNGAELISAIETDNNMSTARDIPITIFSNLSDYPQHTKLNIRKPIKNSVNIFSKPQNGPTEILNNILKAFPNINDTQLVQTELLEQEAENNNLSAHNRISNIEENILSMLNSQSTKNNDFKQNQPQDTDTFVQLLQKSMEGINTLDGGSKKITTNKNTANTINGTRNMRNYSELTEALDMFGGESTEPIADDLARAIENKAGKYHEISLDKILTFLKDKNDILRAKAVKALIYGEIKKTKPELSNLDRAMETLNAISKEKVIDILKQKTKIQEIMTHLTNKKNKLSNKSTSNNTSSEFQSSIGTQSTDSMN